MFRTFYSIIQKEAEEHEEYLRSDPKNIKINYKLAMEL
jgi:hypothetical protein